jgi:hypothetical protein
VWRPPMAGQSVDVPQGATKRAARRGKRVGKVDNLDAERREVALELVALFGALPVVSLEQNIEAKILPDVDLVVRQRRDRGIDETNVADDLDPLGEGITGDTPLCRISTSSATTPAIRYSQCSLARRSKLRWPM